MKKYLYILITACISLTSCSKYNKGESITMELIDSIKIDVSNYRFVPKTNASFIFKDDDFNEYLAFLEKENNKMLFFDLQNDKLLKIVSYDFDGPNGVGVVRGMHIHNFDSIFITSAGDQKLYLTDTTGAILNYFDYSITTDGKYIDIPYYSKSNKNTDLVIVDNQVFMTNYLPGNYLGMSKSKLGSYNLATQINLDTKEVFLLDITYPELWNEGKYPPEFARAFNGENFTYLWPFSHTIYTTTKKHDVLKRYNIESSFFQKFTTPLLPNSNIDDIIAFYLSSPRYENIVWDEYRKLYYVIVLLGGDISTTTNLRNEMGFESDITVIILNSSMEKVGETKLTKRHYMKNNILLGKRGLYFSTNHKDNPTNDDDFLSYHIFLPQNTSK